MLDWELKFTEVHPSICALYKSSGIALQVTAKARRRDRSRSGKVGGYFVVSESVR